MKQNSKERTKQLIELGGIVKIAELDKLEPALLLGLLMVAKASFERMEEEKKNVLKKNGSKIFTDRKAKNPIKSNDFEMKNEIEVENKWLL